MEPTVSFKINSPAAFRMIFESAFSAQAFAGGTVGALHAAFNLDKKEEQ